jgi:putative membrane-bound dehydrogenase-like protein
MEISEGLEVSLFAHEPMLVNPTNMDIDHRGRIWVCEGYNYRLPLNPDKSGKAEGDRILILEDTDFDGKADKQTVFYQGNDINAALGICVLGNKVFVSKSPNIIVFTDSDGDDKPDKKEILFSGMDAEEHDHGIHALVFGPDGKLYFNAGNEIHQMNNPDGTPAVDLAGNQVNDSGNPYRQGMAFRCNLDGSDLETLGWNFRNPYELAVDSYGNIWQSDNDDDGNRGTRLNLVVEYGNYGFTNEMTGEGWRTKRTGMAAEIPLRHWHLNDPGVVPNLLQLYAGSPTGILFYEGDLMPVSYRNSLIHAEAGANVIRSYPLTKNGYGYQSSVSKIMEAFDDPWFRPTDVCVAPDGSIFVSDWYDPGVGGHQVGDQQKGRIFRIAPERSKYSVPQKDLNSIPGLINALKSPNQSIRFLAWQGLNQSGKSAKPALLALFQEKDPLFSARALWLLAELDAAEAIALGLSSPNEDIQVTAIKIARQKFPDDLLHFLGPLKDSNSMQVQRELAIALRFQKNAEAAQVWARLASRYRGDRWFLEALGIGSDLNADACFKAWLTIVGDNWKKEFHEDIVWRTRSKTALPLLAELILAQDDIKNTHKYFRAFDFHQSNAKNQTIEQLLSKVSNNRIEYLKLAFAHLDKDYVLSSPKLTAQLREVVEGYRGTDDFLRTIDKYQLKHYSNELLTLVLQRDQQAVNAARLLLKNDSDLLTNVLNGKDEQQISSVIFALGTVNSNQSLDILQNYMLDQNNPRALRQYSAQHFATGWTGENRTLDLLDKNQIPEDLIPAIANSLSTARRAAIRTAAAKYLGNEYLPVADLPSIKELVLLEGNVESGAAVYEKLCSSCHLTNGKGVDFGPGLSEIGAKLSKEALYTSILNPDAGISFGYEGYLVTLNDGTKLIGLVHSRSENEIVLKQIGGTEMVIQLNTIESIEQMENSLMTPNLSALMDQQELVDLIAYLEQLKATI